MNGTSNLCPHCGADVPAVAMTAEVWRAVTAELTRGSRTMAEAQICSYGLADATQSARFIDHTLACIHSWPFDDQVLPILDDIDRAFGMVPRPEHFANFEHCDDCAETDRKLCSKSIKTITRDDLNVWGYDPFAFVNDQGWAYYFPALARFAVVPPIWRDRGCYAERLAQQLSSDGPDNRHLKSCTGDQRLAVAALIDSIAENESVLDRSPYGPDRFWHASWQSWHDGARIWRGD